MKTPELDVKTGRFAAERLVWPILAAVLVCTATVIIWRALIAQERRSTEQEISAISQHLARKLQLDLFERSNTIERIAGRWGTRGGTPRREWEADALSYVEAQGGYKSIHWIDPTGRIQWIVPTAGNSGVVGRMGGDTPDRKRALEQSRNRQAPEITPIRIGGENSPSTFVIYDSVFTHDTFWGWMGGELDLGNWFDSVWYNVPKKSFVYHLAERGQLVARGGAVDLPVDDSLRQTVLLHIGRTPVDVFITPTRQWVMNTRSSLPRFVLLTGLAIAFLTGWVMHLALLGRFQYLVLRAETDQRMLAEAKSDTLLAHLPMEVLFKDTDLRYVSYNPTWLKRHNLQPGEAKGRSAHDLFPAELADRITEADRKVLQTGETIDREETVPGPGSDERILRTLRTRVSNELGHVIGVLVINYDITEQRDREKLERELDRRITRAKKLDSIGQMVGWVAHDLNNLIAPVTGFSELILGDLPEDSPVRQDVLEIQSAGYRASRVLSDLLMINPKYGSALGAVDLNEQLSYFLGGDAFLNTKAEHPGIEVITDFEADCPAIQGTSTRLEQLLANITLNAFASFDPECAEGTITLSTRRERLEESIRGYDAIEAGDYLTLRVVDSAGVISAEHLERIFEPFYLKQMMGRGSGTGLGLAAVYGIVKDLQGYIDVRSDAEGTEFVFYFPTTAETAEPAPEALADITGSGHVLVVDDVLQQRDLACRFLTKLGYEVSARSSGEDAVDFLRKSKVDLVLLDMHMEGGMDGLETYREILDIHPGQRCLIATGFAMTPKIAEVLELGAGDCVRKPYDLEKIGRAVRSELNGKGVPAGVPAIVS